MSFDDDVLASLALNSLSGLGPSAFRDLLARYGSSQAIVDAKPSAWPEFSEHAIDVASATSDLKSSFVRAKADLELVERWGVEIYLAHKGPYPAMLRQTACPPPVLYVMGENIAVDAPAVAIVGSRFSTHYGEKVARRLSQDLSSAGVVTVSGLARGIDTCVHEATLASGGVTWAVVGSGLMMTYPPENRSLAERIARQGGAVISEFAMAARPHPSHFPRRNRIIAGISRATVVVEGREASGALITARLAANEGRDVFAVPGPVSSHLSRAPHRLLREGAALAESAEDILRELGLPTGSSIEKVLERADLDGKARSIVEAVGDVPLDRDELLSRLSVDAKDAAALVVQLEIQGLIKTLPGGKLVRA